MNRAERRRQERGQARGAISLNAASLRRLTELAFFAAGAQQVASIATSTANQAQQRLLDVLASLVEIGGGDPTASWTIDFARSELRQGESAVLPGQENGAKESEGV